MAKKQIDTLKAKQKKQKIVAAGLSVVFLGVLGFEGPKTWKKLHPPASQAALSYDERPASSTTTTPSLAAPTLAGSEAPSGGAASSSGLASSPAPAVTDGQLTSFSRFASKDPFAQQLSDSADGSSGGSAASSSGASGASGGGATSSSGSGSSSGSASDPKPGTAVISVNGVLYTVAVGTDFPQASDTDPSVVPLFHLISATAHSVKISIVGGSYASGTPAVTLQENKPVTLMNTADGTRYKLILRPVGTAVAASAAPATSNTSTTVTVPPPAAP